MESQETERQEIIRGLTAHLHDPKAQEWRGRKELTSYLIWWFENQMISQAEDEQVNRLYHGMPAALLNAMEYWRTSGDLYARNQRANFLERFGQEKFPELTDFSADDGRLMIIAKLAHLVAKATGRDEYSDAIDGYFRAEDHLVSHAIQRFARQVWRGGLWRIISQDLYAGWPVQLGGVWLVIDAGAGRLQVMFSASPVEYEGDFITFLTGDDDDLGIELNPLVSKVKLSRALELINKVTDAWPTAEQDQLRLVRPSLEV